MPSLPAKFEHVASCHGEVASGIGVRSDFGLDGYACPCLSSDFDDDAGRDGLLQEDGGRLPDGDARPSLLREGLKGQPSRG
jgi:hypothetical protein